jgi:putative endonuclease
MRAHGGYVYIVSNKTRSVLYIGVTSNLWVRINQHKSGQGSAFTSKYNCTDLLYYEFYPTIEEALERETQLKWWKRAWKDELIEKFNPTFRDLTSEVEDME